jgi:hypothetical protein
MATRIPITFRGTEVPFEHTRTRHAGGMLIANAQSAD